MEMNVWACLYMYGNIQSPGSWASGFSFEMFNGCNLFQLLDFHSCSVWFPLLSLFSMSISKTWLSIIRPGFWSNDDGLPRYLMVLKYTLKCFRNIMNNELSQHSGYSWSQFLCTSSLFCCKLIWMMNSLLQAMGWSYYLVISLYMLLLPDVGFTSCLYVLYFISPYPGFPWWCFHLDNISMLENNSILKKICRKL
jgi:hypothetical protein